MELIGTKDVAKITGMRGSFVGDNAAKLMMSVLKLDKINSIYSRHHTKPARVFIDSVLDDTQIRYHFSDMDLARIPSEGSFIIVANHPFGGIEGLILLNKILQVRPDFKIIGNFLFNHLEPVQEYVFGVNPFEGRKHLFSGFLGLRKAFNHIKEGHPLAIFPAGEVSTWYNDSRFVADRDWHQSIIRFIRDAEVPVVPVYFHGGNSRMFHLMGKVHPMLRTARIPTELLNKQHEIIRVRVGNPIAVKDVPVFEGADAYGRWLRAKTYLLEAGLDTGKGKLGVLMPLQQAFAPAVPKSILLNELRGIAEDCLLYEHGNFSMYCVPSVEIPHIAFEIGRLREVTFRAVGEGTNMSADIDAFDRYYHQLFIWDHAANCIVGGYRIGKGKEIMAMHGVKGFYINSLFRISDRMKPLLSESIELGRSFIVREYQRKSMSLFMLWKGILYFLLKNDEYRYMIGPVSISNSYTDLSKKVITEWVLANYKAESLEGYMVPRHSYVPADTRTDTGILVDNVRSVQALDLLVAEIEPRGMKMPVLLKKYLSLGGKVACFNVDPQFNNALDALLLLDLYDVPADVVHSLSKELHTDVLPGRRMVKVF